MTLAELNLMPRRIYATRTDDATGEATLTLSDSEVVLDRQALAVWSAVAQWLSGGLPCRELPSVMAQTPQNVAGVLQRFQQAGLLVAPPKEEHVGAAAFYSEHFEPLLPAWLNEAFSHPFWERMMGGRGNERLYAGWLIELYHYTRNANRHMPLAAAHCRSKPIKALFAKHYEEEWNHYHFFAKATAAMGLLPDEVAHSSPLPMTMEMSDFMRQAARTDMLCYAICSAVLEGTTTDGAAFNPFYERMQELYRVPRAAVTPIYDHLELDAKYQHANLFKEICTLEGSISARRAARVLDFGHQMVEHIWLWTDDIEQYYGNPANPMPKPQFDTFLD